MSNINVMRKNLGPVTAYKYAVQQGYTGTEQEFAALMASYATVAEEAESARDDAVDAKTAAETAQAAAEEAASQAEGAIEVDDTLSVKGRAADAKVTGYKTNLLESKIDFPKDTGVIPTIVIGSIGIETGAPSTNSNIVRTKYPQKIEGQIVKLLNNNWKVAIYWYTTNSLSAGNYLGRTTYFNDSITSVDIDYEKEKSNNLTTATYFAIVFYRWTGTDIDVTTAITQEELESFNGNYKLMGHNYIGDIIDNIANLNYVLVSAADSPSIYSNVSNYKCSGTNDELVIQEALDDAVSKNKELWLAPGNYSIDAFYDGDHAGDGLHAIWIKVTKSQHTTTIKGIGGKPIRKYSTTSDLNVGAILRVSQECYDALDSNSNYAVIAGNGATYNNRKYPWLDLDMKNVGIVLPDNQKKIICIDGYYLTRMQVENVLLACTGTIKNGVSGCIGIRGMCGSGFGEGQEWKHCFAWGFHTGYAVAGEHLVCVELGARFCDYGYRFNDFPSGTGGNWRHPITLINCCDECNFNMPYFGNSGNYANLDSQTEGKQNINLINFNFEWFSSYTQYGGDYAKEQFPGCAYITVEFTLDKGSNRNSIDVPFWESGYGQNSRTVNLAHKSAGTTSERLTYAANPHQQYYDTSLNKMLFYENNKWVDAMGIDVD